MKENRFSTTLAFALGALIVQFLLGMAVNLFVKIPSDHPGANPPALLYRSGIAGGAPGL
jgi:hypothetical protein